MRRAGRRRAAARLQRIATAPAAGGEPVSAFRHGGFAIDDLLCRLGTLEYVRDNDPERWREQSLAAEYDRLVPLLRDWLLGMRGGIDEVLAALCEAEEAR